MLQQYLGSRFSKKLEVVRETGVSLFVDSRRDCRTLQRRFTEDNTMPNPGVDYVEYLGTLCM
jgi:hypothetical protein